MTTAYRGLVACALASGLLMTAAGCRKAERGTSEKYNLIVQQLQADVLQQAATLAPPPGPVLLCAVRIPAIGIAGPVDVLAALTDAFRDKGYTVKEPAWIELDAQGIESGPALVSPAQYAAVLQAHADAGLVVYLSGVPPVLNADQRKTLPNPAVPVVAVSDNPRTNARNVRPDQAAVVVVRTPQGERAYQAVRPGAR